MNWQSYRRHVFEILEQRLPLAVSHTTHEPVPIGTQAPLSEEFVATVPFTTTADSIGLTGSGQPWASARGLYVFSLSAYQGVWAPKTWSLAQWETWLDQMQFLHLNHLELPRAPWSERPAQTSYELDKENLWISVLQAAKARGMTTSIIFGTTHHGDLTVPWRILSPGASPADPNWQTLLSDYQYWANRYGPWVDQWMMGVEDPGGSPSSAGLNWPYETPSPLGDPSYVTQLVSLELAMRAAAQAVNPSSTVVANTWGLQWWGIKPGYPSHISEFLANVPRLPPGVPLSTHGADDSLTDTLQATGREVDAWPFFLIDHEFPTGHTKLHFNWTSSYLQQIKNQGIQKVIAHISHPIEQLPSLYIYSRLLEDSQLSETTLLTEFAELLVYDAVDQASLANAIKSLGQFWDSVSGIANWDASTLQPVFESSPYTPKYNATQLGYLSSALNSISSVDTPRAVTEIPMLITAEAWIKMLGDQIKFLYDAAHFGTLLGEGNVYLDANYASVADLSEPLSRTTAESVLQNYLQAGANGSLNRMESYLKQFWSVTTGLNHPLGIIYDYLRSNVPISNAGIVRISGDFLEYDAPSHDALFKQLGAVVEQTDDSFSFQHSGQWIVDTNPNYSGGSAMVTSVTNSEVNIVFAGSGISLLHSTWNLGATATWSIDQGAGGSGTINMMSTDRRDRVTTTLATNLTPTLHTLTIKKASGGGSIVVDGVEVRRPGSPLGDFDRDQRVSGSDLQLWKEQFGQSVAPTQGADANGDGRIDGGDFLSWQRNLGQVGIEGGMRLRRENDRSDWQYSNNWIETTEGSPSGGNWTYSLADGASINVPFEGTAIVISATTRSDYGLLGWSIDGGAGGSGTINLAAPHNTFRKPFVLTTTLAGGSHVLKLTKQGGFLVNVDSIDTLVPDAAFVSAESALQSAKELEIDDSAPIGTTSSSSLLYAVSVGSPGISSGTNTQAQNQIDSPYACSQEDLIALDHALSHWQWTGRYIDMRTLERPDCPTVVRLGKPHQSEHAPAGRTICLSPALGGPLLSRAV